MSTTLLRRHHARAYLLRDEIQYDREMTVGAGAHCKGAPPLTSVESSRRQRMTEEEH